MVMDDEGVVEAIRHHIADIHQQSGMRISFECDEPLPPIDSRVEGAVYRVVQEALTNVRRHSRADKANVTITAAGSSIEVDVEDQGVGFNPEDVGPDSFGLRGIRERARLFGGVADIHSTRGHGTRVHAEFPLQPATTESA